MDKLTRWGDCDIYLFNGDITTLDVDAIVNAANSQLGAGGGVCGAIHHKGGKKIAEECATWIKTHGPVSTGGAAITTGGNLPAKHVIHAVGPVYGGDFERARELLATAYRGSLRMAHDRDLKSIAFPSLSTGHFGYPRESACPVAIAAVKQELAVGTSLDRVVFCVFGQADYNLYREHLIA